MKINNQGARAIQLILIILIVGITVLNLFFPQYTVDMFSLNGIKEKETNLVMLNQTIASNENTISSSISQLESSKTRSEESKKRVESIRNKIKNEDLVFHMPSILISLEQNAIKNNLKIIIGFSQIQDSANGGQNVGQDLGEDPNGVVENPNGQPSSTGITSGGVGSVDFSQALSENDFPYIQGINVKAVPVQIIGNYANVRAFVNFLDTLDYVEPGYIDLVTNGDEITGTVVINVLYGEVLF